MTEFIGGREQEAALIGAVLRKPALYDSLSETITPKTFGWVAYGWAWEAMASLKKSGMKIDTLTVGDELERMTKLGQFKAHDTSHIGRAALSDIRSLGEPENAQTYASNVLDYSKKRLLALKASEMYNHAVNGRKADDIISDMNTFLSSIPTGEADEFVDSKTAMSEALDATEEASRGNANVVPTGLIDLDKMLRKGAREGRLYIVAAPSGEGKSAFLVNLMRNAVKAGKRPGFLSMEMSTTEQVNRLAGQLCGVDVNRIESGDMGADEWEAYYKAVAEVETFPIAWDDTPTLTMPQVRHKARKMAERGLDVLMVDSLNLLDAQSPSAKKHETINTLSYQLATLARELKIPVWCAHHVNREAQKVDGQKEREPRLSDLEQSGDKAAYVVMFLYHFAGDQINTRRLKIAKNRGGPTGYVDLIFQGGPTKFDNAVARHVDLNLPRPRDRYETEGEER